MRPLWLALRHTARLLTSARRLWIPYAVIAVGELLAITVLWLAPHPPFSTLLAPPIRYFFSERVLHYPAHLWFMFHAMRHAHFVIALLIGAYLSGAVCLMVGQVHQGKPISLRDAMASGRIRYGRVTLLWLVTWGLARLLSEGLGVLPPTVWMLVGGTLAVLVAQALVVYAIPAAVFEQLSWWRALFASVREAIRHPFATFAVVILPSIAVIAFSIWMSPARVGQWMKEGTPEIALGCILVRLAVWTIADAVLTIAVAHLWWTNRSAGTAVNPTAAPTAPPANSGAKALAALALLTMPFLSGCSTNYDGERLYWKAQQYQAQTINKDPKKAAPEQYAVAIQMNERLLQRAAGTSWAAKAQVAIGSLYALQDRYDEARDAFQLVLQNYNSQRELCLNARLGIAKTYEAQQRWDDAVAAYQQISDYHAWTRMGLEAPLYIATIYRRQGETEQATKSYDRAIRFYAKLIPDAPTPEAAMVAKNYLAMAYQWGSEWDKAIEVLEEIADSPSGVDRPMVLLTLASLYQTKVDNLPKAEATYQTLVQEFPEHPFGKVARSQLEQLGHPMPAPAELTAPPQQP